MLKSSTRNEGDEMKSELEMMVEEDMIAAGYNPELWADVVEYWNEILG